MENLINIAIKGDVNSSPFIDDKNWSVYAHILPMEVSNYKHDKYYIGITSQKPETRWHNGRGYGNNKHFTNAIQKYGWDNFKHEILFTNLTKQEACEKEQELIIQYKSYIDKYGYNKTLGGEGILGYHHSEQNKKLQSQKMTGKNNPFYGKTHSAQSIEKIKNAYRHHGKDHPLSVQVICLNTLEIFESENAAATAYNLVSGGSIGKAIRTGGYAGLHPETKAKLYWDIYNEKIEYHKINDIEFYHKKVILINTMEVFDNVYIASETYHIPACSIYSSCSTNGTSNTGGIDKFTGKILLWLYYNKEEDYSHYYNTLKYPTRRPIVCLNHTFITMNVVDMANYYNISRYQIYNALSDRIKKDYVVLNNEKLRFKYYDELSLQEKEKYFEQFDELVLLNYNKTLNKKIKEVS